jgi:uncharacterized protein (TIGR03067 family)
MSSLQDFEGTWQAVLQVEDGQGRYADELRGTVSGDQYTLHRGGYSYHGTSRGIDPGWNHGPIDFVVTGPEGAGKRWLGIYVLEDQELTVCVARPGRARPESFAPGRANGHWLYLLKRCAPAEVRVAEGARCPPEPSLRVPGRAGSVGLGGVSLWRA